MPWSSYWHETDFATYVERALDRLWFGTCLHYVCGHKLDSFDFWVSAIAKQLETSGFASTYRVL